MIKTMKSRLKLFIIYCFLIFGTANASDDYNYIEKCEPGEFKNNLVRIYENDPTLTNLSLIGVGTMEVEAVSWALSRNTNLTELDFTSSHSYDDGVIALANVLKTNRSLLRVNLTNNHIGTLGAEALNEALKVNTHVIEMNLSLNNKIDNEGVTNYSDSIKKYIDRNIKTLEEESLLYDPKNLTNSPKKNDWDEEPEGKKEEPVSPLSDLSGLEKDLPQVDSESRKHQISEELVLEEYSLSKLTEIATKSGISQKKLADMFGLLSTTPIKKLQGSRDGNVEIITQLRMWNAFKNSSDFDSMCEAYSIDKNIVSKILKISER